MKVVSNSTPLIALSRINKFSLLKEYFGAVYIPKEVYEEVVTRGGNLFGAEEVASAEWIKVEKVKNSGITWFKDYRNGWYSIISFSGWQTRL